jgi:thioredoxin-like negative regulator of GroEL
MTERRKYVHTLEPRQEINSNKVVIKIGANWCGACQQNKSTFEKIARRSHRNGKKTSFYEVDIDVFSKEKKVTKIVRKTIEKTTSMPTFFFISEGRIVGKLVGYSPERFKQKLELLN